MVWLESNIPGLVNIEFLYEGGTAPLERTKLTTFSSTLHGLHICCETTFPGHEEGGLKLLLLNTA